MRKLLLSFFISSLGLIGVNAQDSDPQKVKLNGMAFRELGPALTSGRIADIAVNPENHNQYYVAVASGGVWKTNNHGTTFTPIFDGEASYSIGCLALDPQNPNVIWVGTGENNNQRSVAFGDGLYRSDDGGKSWQKKGLEKSEHIGMIRIHPENSNIIYVAAYGPLWSAGGERGIYKSTDGGENWELILEVSENTGFNEIHFDPLDPETLYATAHQRRRHVWTYVSGGPESALYKSTDGGENWQKLSKGLPGEMGRIGLAIPPHQSDRIYAMVEGHGTYRSDDRGASFRKLNDYNTSGNYYVELVAHPQNPDILYSMDTYMHVSTNGGESWERVPEKNKHVDNHCLWINPNDPDQMIAGCDGGLYESYDAGQNWQFKPNLPVTQFYRVALDNAKPFYNVYGGTQDNFSLGGPSQTINSRGVVNSDWFVTNTGDGFESQIDPVDPNIVYAQAQYGWLVRYDRQSGESVGIKPSPGIDEQAYRWNWDAPLLISPHNRKRLYFAANKVFKSEDQGNNWQVISPDLTQQIDRHTLPVMGEIQSVDAISYDRSTSAYGNITSLDESPLKEGLLYIGTDDGLIQVSEDGGLNWRKISTFPGVPANTYVNQVLADLHGANTVYALFNNHKNGDFKPYVLKSSDRGQTWVNITGDLPERGSVFAMRQDHLEPELFFIGTEFGAFFSSNGGTNWRQFKKGLPTIAIRDLELQRRENDLVLASFGRGFYVLDDYSPLREHNKNTYDQESHLYAIDTALVFMEAEPLGYGKKGFMGATYYTAPNPELGACFTLYLKEVPQSLKAKRQKKEKEARKNNESVSYPALDSLRKEREEESAYLLWIIKNEMGKEVRRFTAKPKSGVNRYYWDGKFANRTYHSDRNEPFTEVSSAQLAPPGTYSVEVFISESGVIRPLNQSGDFELRWLNNNSFRATDYQALVAFQDSLEDIRREMVALQKKHEKLTKKAASLKNSARNTASAPLTLLNDLQKLEQSLREIDLALNGDDLRSELNFETKPSLMSRLGSAVWNSYATTSAPTGEQRKNLAILEAQKLPLQSNLKKIEAELDNFYRILLNSGAPYLDGELD
jgi:photosystem II stability/assembly factor-like uncharacterized protein